MSGTVCGILDAYIELSNPYANQSMFTTTYRFFERMVAQGNAERVALQYGASGTGTGYWDEADPFGENAFFVYKLLASTSTERDYDLYVLGQWADGDTFGSSPGNPGSVYSADCVALIMAFREDGTSPWAGTTNNDGTDTKGTPVWTDGGSTVHVVARSCSNATPNGSYVTNKERLLYFGDFNSSTNRLCLIGDADGFVIATQPNGADDWVLGYMGMYVPRTGLSIDYPICAYITPLALTYTFPDAVTIGSYLGNTYYEGGIIGSNIADDVESMALRTPKPVLTGARIQPNNQISPAQLDEFPVFVFNYESAAGLCGQIPPNLLACVGNASPNTMSTDGTRAYIGFNNLIEVKASIPWDGLAPPALSYSRTGRTL